MIKKLINKLFSKKITDEEIECAIDEQIVDCAEMDADPYVGVPAPILRYFVSSKSISNKTFFST